jgi:O-acetylserine/cysteine efflux transporter
MAGTLAEFVGCSDARAGVTAIRRCQQANLGNPTRNMGARSRFALSTALLTVASINPAIGGVVMFRMAASPPVPWLRRPAVALVVAAGLWGVAVSGTKYALGGFDPVTLLSIELLTGAGVLWVALLVRGYRPPRSWWLPAVLGLLEPALAYLGDTFGLSLTSAVHGAVINGVESGLVVLLAAVLLRETITRPAIIAVVVALGGLAVLAGVGTGAGGGTAAGDLLVAGGVLSASLYTIVAKRFDDGSDALSLTTWQFSVATLVSLLVAIPRWAAGTGTVSPAARFWLVAVLVGAGGFGLSFLLFNMVIVQVDAGRAAVILNLIPVFGIASAVIFLGEGMTGRDALGAVLIGSSVVYFTIADHREATTRGLWAGKTAPVIRAGRCGAPEDGHGRERAERAAAHS